MGGAAHGCGRAVEKSAHCETCDNRDPAVILRELSEGGQSIPEKLALQLWKLGLFFSFLPSVQTNYEARWGYCIDMPNSGHAS